MNLRHLLDLSRISLRNLHLHSGSRGNTRSSVSRIFSGGENYLHAIRESSSKISSPPRRGFLPASSSGISSRVINNGSESRERQKKRSVRESANGPHKYLLKNRRGRGRRRSLLVSSQFRKEWVATARWTASFANSSLRHAL